MKRFLITTANETNWRTDLPVLFLGEWCRLYSRKHIWEKIDYEILPYHWDDRTKLYNDYHYVSKLYEKYLNLISKKLNEIHNVSYPTQYWRIVIGEWLHFFVEIFYDRYSSIIEAIRSDKIAETWISPTPDWKLVPNDFTTFNRYFVSDNYNHYLYSYIIKRMGKIPFQIKENEQKDEIARKEKDSKKHYSKNLLKNVIKRYPSLVPSILNRIVFVNSYLQTKDLRKLLLIMGQAPNPFTRKYQDIEHKPDPNLRNSILLDKSDCPFESLLNDIIFKQMPTVHLEGYAEMHDRALTSFPKYPELIYTANAFSNDEGFKLWTAYNLNKGAKLIIGQHGGHYGSGLWSTTEDHEINMSSYYFTWGWNLNGNSKTVPMPSGSLIGLKNKRRINSKGKILWVLMSLPRYFYFFYSVPVGPQVITYFKEQERFGKAVSQEVRNQLLVRLYHYDYGWDQEERLAEIDPNLNIYHGNKPMREQLLESRMLISTYNSTTYLESFAANHPTIIFWNPNHWELRDSAKPFFGKLQQAGILHYSPESAAAKVIEVYNDPEAWWFQPDVQDAKDQFCEQYARTSKNWINEWARVIDKILKQTNN